MRLQVWVTDGSPAAVENCREGLELNRFGVQAGGVQQRMRPEVTQPRPGEAGGVAADQSSRCAHACGCAEGVDMRVRVLEWGSEAVDAEVVLAADVVYDPELLTQLVAQLQAQLRGPSLYAFVATAVRNPETLQRFLDECGGHGLRARVEEAATTGQGPGMRVRFHHCCELEKGHQVVLHRITAT